MEVVMRTGDWVSSTGPCPGPGNVCVTGEAIDEQGQALLMGVGA
jgi:hypothetical protein